MGRVGAFAKRWTSTSLRNIAIFSYARNMLGFTALPGTRSPHLSLGRRSYQMDPATSGSAEEVELDLEEGRGYVMVKPAWRTWM